ncbi:hypothetical protein C0993_006658, partial [Termitomyces sp. T159_Od127]
MSDGAQPDPDASSNLHAKRQPSLRQQEKAPDGREPRLPPEHEGDAEHEVQEQTPRDVRED